MRNKVIYGKKPIMVSDAYLSLVEGFETVGSHVDSAATAHARQADGRASVVSQKFVESSAVEKQVLRLRWPQKSASNSAQDDSICLKNFRLRTLGIPQNAAIYPIPGLGFINLNNGGCPADDQHHLQQ